MRATLAQIPNRLELKEDKTEGIIRYDADNAYPQRIMRAIAGSGTAEICYDRLSKFIIGKGFEDENFSKARINSKQTTDQLLRLTTKDYTAYRGFAIHVQYDLLFRISALTHIPFENVRFSKPDDYGHVQTMKIYDDWAKEKRKKLNKDLIEEINVYNPDPEAIKSQIEKAGGYSKYKGQIYYYSSDGENTYPTSLFDPVMDDMLAEQESSAYRYENVSTKFLANYILVTHKFESSDEDEDENEAREELKSNITDFQGGRNASKIMLLETEDAELENAFKLHKMDVTKDDDIFEFTETASTSKIRKRAGLPPILIGEEITGHLGDSTQIENAYKYVNKITTDDRRVISEVFQELIPRFRMNINPSGNYNIMMLDHDIDVQTKDDDAPQNRLVEILGVEGTQALTAMLASPDLTEGQKINTAQLIFGLERSQAEALVKGTAIV